MKKDKILPIFLFSLVLFLASFILGYQLMDRNLGRNNTSKLDEEKIDIQKVSDSEILKEETRISPNTVMEERIHYTSCDHVITKLREVNNELVNMSREEFSDYIDKNFPDNRIISYSSKKITLGITKNHLCENHYIIGEEEGKIAIFKIGENGEWVLEKVFIDYPISLLMEIDQEKIIEGIRVDSEEELTEILENFISWLS